MNIQTAMKFIGIRKKFKTAKTVAKDLDTRIGILESQMQTVITQGQALQAEVTALKARVAILEAG
jgi:hypothetical protein